MFHCYRKLGSARRGGSLTGWGDDSPRRSPSPVARRDDSREKCAPAEIASATRATLRRGKARPVAAEFSGSRALIGSGRGTTTCPRKATLHFLEEGPTPSFSSSPASPVRVLASPREEEVLANVSGQSARPTGGLVRDECRSR